MSTLLHAPVAQALGDHSVFTVLADALIMERARRAQKVCVSR